MGIPSEIVSIGQSIDTNNGATFNNIVFRLPNGQTFEAIVEDRAMQALTLMVGQNLARGQGMTAPMTSAPPVPADAPQPSPEMSGFGSKASYGAVNNDDALVTAVFGGEAEGAVQVSDFPLPPGVVPPAPQHSVVSLGTEPPERLSVSKDSLGYPVVRGGHRADPGEVVGGGEGDEDGVPSV